MTVPIDIRELTTRLEEAIALVDGGDEVILTDGAMPVARFVALHRNSSGTDRTPGLHHSAIETSDDFDAPLPDKIWANHS